VWLLWSSGKDVSLPTERSAVQIPLEPTCYAFEHRSVNSAELLSINRLIPQKTNSHYTVICSFNILEIVLITRIPGIPIDNQVTKGYANGIWTHNLSVYRRMPYHYTTWPGCICLKFLSACGLSCFYCLPVQPLYHGVWVDLPFNGRWLSTRSRGRRASSAHYDFWRCVYSNIISEF